MFINYDHYRIFYFVAKYGSFTKAADILLCNQPNLTRTVRSLETSLGCTLFERSNKGVKLTPDGEKLFDHISIAFEHIEAGEQEIASKSSLKKGVLSIGASEIALRCFLLPILNEYRQKYPGIQIKISNVSTPSAVTMLKSGLVDLAFVTSPVESNSELSKKNLRPLHEVAICGEAFSSLVNSETPVSFRRIAKRPIVSLGPKTSTYEFYFKLFLEHGVNFSSDIEAATADQIIPLVRHNLGIGFVPVDFLEDITEDSKIKIIPLKEEIPKRYITFLKKKGRTLSPPAKELERIILDNI
ncbi:MAG: LysR family transcriptional regulator [Ruminococcus sp.]